MPDLNEFDRQRARISAALQDKLRLRPAEFAALLGKARSRLPRALRKEADLLVQAEALSTHPRLRLTLDQKALAKASRRLLTHLDTVDLAEARKTRWLSALGGAAFSLIAVAALLIIVLRWRGFL